MSISSLYRSDFPYVTELLLQTLPVNTKNHRLNFVMVQFWLACWRPIIDLKWKEVDQFVSVNECHGRREEHEKVFCVFEVSTRSSRHQLDIDPRQWRDVALSNKKAKSAAWQSRNHSQLGEKKLKIVCSIKRETCVRHGSWQTAKSQRDRFSLCFTQTRRALRRVVRFYYGNFQLIRTLMQFNLNILRIPCVQSHSLNTTNCAKNKWVKLVIQFNSESWRWSWSRAASIYTESAPLLFYRSIVQTFHNDYCVFGAFYSFFHLQFEVSFVGLQL